MSYDPSVLLGSQSFAFAKDFLPYCLDSCQRALLTFGALNKAGNNHLDCCQKDEPLYHPDFPYKVIVPGRDLGKPVNFSLVRIEDRRQKPDRRQPGRVREIYDDFGIPTGQQARGPDRRSSHSYSTEVNEDKEPLFFLDPRAGHMPGIGGSKPDSQIGRALLAGHPVYACIFSAQPVAHQTIEDIVIAQAQFLRRITELHPRSPQPVVIGNCQGGWGAALTVSTHPDLAKLLILTGAPMSFHTSPTSPLAHLGVLGGLWALPVMHLFGNGCFDGANLVANFERLNLTNTLLTKMYNLFARIDTEAPRFCAFERWWGTYCLLTAKEMDFIIGQLFVGNRLEKGQIILDGKKADLTQVDTILVFASHGDNITPPRDALGWIRAAYKNADEIAASGKRIIYCLHPLLGHLALFTSGKAMPYHELFFKGMKTMLSLEPGLYEMAVTSEEGPENSCTYRAVFEPRRIEPIRWLDDKSEEKGQQNLAAICQFQMKMADWFKPYLAYYGNESLAEFFRQFHPLRTKYIAMSNWNPLMFPLQMGVRYVQLNRYPLKEGNLYKKQEEAIAEFIKIALNGYTKWRDDLCGFFTKAIYNNPLTDLYVNTLKTLS